MSNQLTIDSVFPVSVCTIIKPEFLNVARTVSTELLQKRQKEIELNESFPSYMTEAINFDPRMLNFSNYVAQTAWNILKMQGYAVENMATYFDAMWCQEHHKGSLMEQHTHGNGNQIVGFYFLDVPENSSSVLFYDPKASKVQINLIEENISKSTSASNIVNYQPKEGMLMLTNAWLPHSFTKNMADSPMRFIHFNVNIEKSKTYCAPSKAEVI